jgi:hypothetical protein
MKQNLTTAMMLGLLLARGADAQFKLKLPGKLTEAMKTTGGKVLRESGMARIPGVGGIPGAGIYHGKLGVITSALHALNSTGLAKGKLGRTLQFAQFGAEAYMTAAAFGPLALQMRAATQGLPAPAGLGMDLPPWARSAIQGYLGAQKSGSIAPLAAEQFGLVMAQIEPLIAGLNAQDKSKSPAGAGSDCNCDAQTLAVEGHSMQAVMINGKTYVAHILPGGKGLIYEITQGRFQGAEQDRADR